MTIDVLIIGQGICGTFLGRELDRAGLSYLVVDEERPYTASRVAAGLINPVTGRRVVKTWMIDELLPFVREVYGEWDADLLRPVDIVDFFPTAQMRLAFLKRIEEGGAYLRLPADDHRWDGLFQYELGFGIIDTCFLVDMPRLLAQARADLAAKGKLREEPFISSDLAVRARMVQYRDIDARWIIYCDGVTAADQGYFSRLPFAPNKGEALVIEAPELRENEFVFKRGLSLTPWKEGLYWAGSSYEWSFANPDPTAAFRERTEAQLRNWLKVPFRTVEHVASVRPATVERRPFVGLHPAQPAVGILNGMGTKGCTLAPFFARQLAKLLAHGEPVMAEADVGRFRNLLGAGRK